MYNGFIITDSMRNRKQYDGNTLKFGITVYNTDYIVKFAKGSYSSLFSEHIASRFIRLLGINCHETWLGYYADNMVVILKDFTNSQIKLRSYKDTRQSSEGTSLSGKEYTYDDVLYLIKKHNKMTDAVKQKMIEHFWSMFICDAILANRDRHHGNWGYLTDGKQCWPAPIYDNGGSLFPDVSQHINKFSDNEYMFLAQRAERYPASIFQMKRTDGLTKKTNYHEMLGDLRVNKTLGKLVKQLKTNVGFQGIFNRIVTIVTELNMIIPIEYRRFYIMITCIRYLHSIERKSIEESYIITRRYIDEIQY